MENTDFGSSKKCIALSRRPLRCGLFNIRSLRNKVCFVVESLAEHNLTFYASLKPGCCLLTSLSSVLLFHLLIPSIMSPDQRMLEGGGGGGGRLICSRALLNVRVVPSHMDVSYFEFMEITFSFHLQNIRMAILYRPGHPGTDRAFMEELASLLRSCLCAGKS